MNRPRTEQSVTLTPEQIAQAPYEVREWLRHFYGADERLDRRLVLERNGVVTSGDQLAICSSLEIKSLLQRLKDDFLSCQALFQLGCEFYDPATGAHRSYTIHLTDFLHHTDIRDAFELQRCLDAINGALCELRHDRDATIYHSDGHDGLVVHQMTQHTIYQLWRRLVRLPSSRIAIPAPDDDHRHSGGVVDASDASAGEESDRESGAVAPTAARRRM